MISSTSPCSRCILRLRNIRQPSQYVKPTNEQSQNPCPTCLGILQEKSLNIVTNLVGNLLPTVTHNHMIKINATLPPSASVIRQRAMALSYIQGHYDHLNLPKPSSTLPSLVSLREALKWTLGPRLESIYSVEYNPDAELFVELIYRHDESNQDATFITSYENEQKAKAHNNHPNGNKRSRGRDPKLVQSTTHINRVLETMTDTQFANLIPQSFLPPPNVTNFVQSQVNLIVSPVYIAGEYNKYSRTISQTPWFVNRYQSKNSSKQQDLQIEQNHIDGKDKEEMETRTESSVEQVVVLGIEKILKPEKTTFTAGGREDVDVRMLGSGRPFIVEIINSNTVASRITPEMVKLMSIESSKLSSAVIINNLRLVPKSYCAQMRMFEAEKRKCYRCLVWTAGDQTMEELKEKLEVENGFLLYQKTPLRVLHRRTQIVRERRIFQAYIVRLVSSNFFVLDVIAQAGTYIKEFVHGDNGRTVPNVASILGCDADILQLDVTEITHDGVDDKNTSHLVNGNAIDTSK